jgi:Hemerythrin HHE cation binding domain
VGLLSRLLGNNRGAKPHPEKPGDNLSPHPHPPVLYDPALITKLKNDHRELLRTFGAVKAAAAESRFGDIAHLLSHFRHTFQMHIAGESAHFYPYLQQRVARDPEAVALIASAHREMNNLAFEVMKVVDAYIAYPPTHLNEAQFNYDLEQAGTLLEKRVQKVEAQLYSLYRP